MSKCTISIHILTTAGIGLICFSVVERPKPIVVWNVSASVPVGLYRTTSGTPILGDLVLVRTPDAVNALADERRYLPGDVPLVKRVAAASGDAVCVSASSVFINGIKAASQLEVDRLGRSLSPWNGCRRLSPDEDFLLGDALDSFDSRYFGPVKRDRVIGRLVPLWTE